MNQSVETGQDPKPSVWSFDKFWDRFSRFGWDAAGIALVAAAGVTLLGFTGLTQGSLLNPWVFLLRRWFGWGGFLVGFGLAGLGLLILGRRALWKPGGIPAGRIVALELLAFTALGLLALNGGQSVERAEAGMDGGLVGWGVAELFDLILPNLLVGPLLAVLAVVWIGWGSGLFGWSWKRFSTWALGETPSAAKPAEPATPVSAAPTTAVAEDDDSLVQPMLPTVRDDRLPPLTLLQEDQHIRPDEKIIHETADKIVQTLAEFGIPAKVRGFRIGPTVTQYAVEPGFVEKTGPDGEVMQQKVRVAQISVLARDLALSLSAERLRIEAPVPGRSYVGIEVPNPRSAVVRLRPMLESESFQKMTAPLAFAIGQDVSGQPISADLARMPHLLIAGTTGSGKSVCISAITTCLVMNNTPDTLRLAMLDPKMVELVRFNGLPHLMGAVETKTERMLGVLRWALMEMDHRYRLLEDAKARDLETYNRKMARRGEPTMPRIVVVVDELADLMMTAPDQTEHNLVRLAQMARATGIHLVVATQRPSADVITGLIKANFPARIAFTVASSIDSRVILDTNGAETLLGRGDMLFLNPESGTPLRAQGVMISDEEMDAVVNFWKQYPADPQPAPWEEILEADKETGSDALVERAVKLVRQSQRASTSLLQRKLRIGFPRAAHLMDELEELGVVGPSQGGGREREVLLAPEGVDDDGELGGEDGDLDDDLA